LGDNDVSLAPDKRTTVMLMMIMMIARAFVIPDDDDEPCHADGSGPDER